MLKDKWILTCPAGRYVTRRGIPSELTLTDNRELAYVFDTQEQAAAVAKSISIYVYPQRYGTPELNTIKYNHRELAREFCHALHRHIGTVGVAKVVELNRREANVHICHSHDFCDANMTMLESWENTFPGLEMDLQDDDHLKAIHEAWTAAAKAEFNAGKI